MGGPSLRVLLLTFGVVVVAAGQKSVRVVPWSSNIRITIPRNAQTGYQVARIGKPPEAEDNVEFRIQSSKRLPFFIDSIKGVIIITKPSRAMWSELLPLEAVVEVISAAIPSSHFAAKLFASSRGKRPPKPRFARRVFHVKIAENNKPGTFLRYLRVRYPHKSSPRNAKIFLATPSNIVSVKPRTGRVVALISFDREHSARYKLNVGLRNKGVPIDWAELVITVTDVNDNAPRFDSDRGQTFSVSENATKGSFVGRLAAVDADAGRNKRFSFQRLWLRHRGGSGTAPFLVKGDGTIYLKWELDREIRAKHTFLVKATDMGNPPLTGTGTVTIKVLDINDSPPKFVHFPKLLITSCQNTAPTEMIGRVQAEDPDEPPHDVVRYSMWEEPGPGQKAPAPSPHTFFIGENSGNIMVSLDPKKECVRRTHNLTVAAFDPWNRSFKTERILKIIVTETDEQADTMRTMIFGTLEPVDPTKTKEPPQNFSFLLCLVVFVSFFAKLLKMLSCAALT